MELEIFLRPNGVSKLDRFSKVTFINFTGDTIECTPEKITNLIIENEITYNFIGETIVKIKGQDILYLKFI